MPIYEYDCESCGHRFEVLVFRADEEVSCPKCGKAEISKRVSTFAPGRSAGRGPQSAPA